MDEKRAIEIIADNLGDSLVVPTNGMISRYLYSIKDRPENFYMLGSMGLASSIGLGLALNCDRRVIVLDGDGACLMNMGAMATIGHYAPKNLTHIVLDNGCYDSTGGQPTISNTVSLEDVALLAGYKSAFLVDTEPELEEALAEKPAFIRIIVEPSEKVDRVSLSPGEITKRFMECIND